MMRRKDRQISKEEALLVVDNCAYGVVSMSVDGEPYAVALSIARDGESIYFHSAAVGKKVDMLRESPKVCVICVGGVEPSQVDFTTKYESAVIFGTAFEITDEEQKISALRLISEKYTPGVMSVFDEEIRRSLKETGVWRISIDEITGKAKR